MFRSLKSYLSLMVVGIFLAIFTGCVSDKATDEDSGGGGNSDDIETSSNPSEALSASVNEMSQSLSSVSSLTAQALVKNIAGVNCTSASDDVELSIDCSDTDHTLVLDRTMNDCTTADEEISITGTHHIEIANMGSGSCTATSQEDRFWSAVQGQGEGADTTALFSTDPDNNPPTASIVRTILDDDRTISVTAAREVTYTDYTMDEATDTQNVSASVTFSSSHIGTNAAGDTIFDFDVSTGETPLTVQFEQVDEDMTRTIETGVITTNRNLLGQTVIETMTNVTWNPTGECDCNPISGTIDIVVTDDAGEDDIEGTEDDNTEVGTGQIEFIAAETGVCDSANVTYDGAEINLPLRNCE